MGPWSTWSFASKATRCHRASGVEFMGLVEAREYSRRVVAREVTMRDPWPVLLLCGGCASSVGAGNPSTEDAAVDASLLPSPRQLGALRGGVGQPRDAGSRPRGVVTRRRSLAARFGRSASRSERSAAWLWSLVALSRRSVGQAPELVDRPGSLSIGSTSLVFGLTDLQERAADLHGRPTGFNSRPTGLRDGPTDLHGGATSFATTRQDFVAEEVPSWAARRSCSIATSSSTPAHNDLTPGGGRCRCGRRSVVRAGSGRSTTRARSAPGPRGTSRRTARRGRSLRLAPDRPERARRRRRRPRTTSLPGAP